MHLPSAKSTAGVFVIGLAAAVLAIYVANRTATGRKYLGPSA